MPPATIVEDAPQLEEARAVADEHLLLEERAPEDVYALDLSFNEVGRATPFVVSNLTDGAL